MLYRHTFNNQADNENNNNLVSEFWGFTFLINYYFFLTIT